MAVDFREATGRHNSINIALCLYSVVCVDAHYCGARRRILRSVPPLTSGRSTAAFFLAATRYEARRRTDRGLGAAFALAAIVAGAVDGTDDAMMSEPRERVLLDQYLF